MKEHRFCIAMSKTVVRLTPYEFPVEFFPSTKSQQLESDSPSLTEERYIQETILIILDIQKEYM